MKETGKKRKSITVLAPIRPLCVPICGNTSFAEDIIGHAESVKRVKTINNIPMKSEIVKGTVSGRFENLTREEIKKITDVVYKQLQTRLKNERRRMGM